eukprot:gene3611-biopygen7841
MWTRPEVGGAARRAQRLGVLHAVRRGWGCRTPCAEVGGAARRAQRLGVPHAVRRGWGCRTPCAEVGGVARRAQRLGAPKPFLRGRRLAEGRDADAAIARREEEHQARDHHPDVVHREEEVRRREAREQERVLHHARERGGEGDAVEPATKGGADLNAVDSIVEE